MKREGAVPIDLVVMNLYPFSKVVDKDNVTIEEARGNIDVGGPSTLRAAAKNWHRVMTLSAPELYTEFIESLELNQGQTDAHERFIAFKNTFHTLSEYDASIDRYLSTQAHFPAEGDIYEFV